MTDTSAVDQGSALPPAPAPAAGTAKVAEVASDTLVAVDSYDASLMQELRKVSSGVATLLSSAEEKARQQVHARFDSIENAVDSAVDDLKHHVNQAAEDLNASVEKFLSVRILIASGLSLFIGLGAGLLIAAKLLGH